LPSRRLKGQQVVKKSKSSGSGKGRGIDGRTRSRTPAQRRSRGNLGRLSRLWNKLTDEQRTAWRHAARDVKSWTRKAHSYPLDGKQLFAKINLVLLLLGREPVTNPPPQPSFGLNPVLALRITLEDGRPALKLIVKGTPAHEIMVFASPPQNAGRGSCRDYRFLGLLSAPVECESAITRLYYKKFGVPPENSRVFIRTWQQENGWEDRGGMRLTSALVPF
jgi:hypothetical protein